MSGSAKRNPRVEQSFERSVEDRSTCRFCGAEVGIGQEFVFEVEVADFEQFMGPIETVNRLPHYYGEPLPICAECRESVEANKADLQEQEARDQADKRAWTWIVVVLMAALVVVLVVAGILDLTNR